MKTASKLKKTLLIAVMISSLIGFMQYAQAEEQASAELGYVSLKNLPSSTSPINPIRLQALRETATTLGARGALAWRSLHIDRALQKQAKYLNHVFDFNQLLLNHNVLPPVIVESNNSLHLTNADTIRLSSKTYRILKPARFVTTPPNWRSYLWMNYKKPEIPNRTLLPQNKDEAAVWDSYLQQGWKQGLAQANKIFAVNLSRLKRDYMGMVLYRKLLDQHMVSSPYVASANLGVTGNSKEIHINDRVLRITGQSKLQPNSSKWTPVLTK